MKNEKELKKAIGLCVDSTENGKCRHLINKNQCNYKIISKYNNIKCYQLMSNEEYITDRNNRLYMAQYGKPKEK